MEHDLVNKYKLQRPHFNLFMYLLYFAVFVIVMVTCVLYSRESWRPGRGLVCCWILAVLLSMTCLWNTDVQISECKRTKTRCVFSFLCYMISIPIGRSNTFVLWCTLMCEFDLYHYSQCQYKMRSVPFTCSINTVYSENGPQDLKMEHFLTPDLNFVFLFIGFNHVQSVYGLVVGLQRWEQLIGSYPVYIHDLSLKGFLLW